MKTPSPFIADGLIILSGGYRGRPMFALPTGAEGDVSLSTLAIADGAPIVRTTGPVHSIRQREQAGK